MCPGAEGEQSGAIQFGGGTGRPNPQRRSEHQIAAQVIGGQLGVGEQNTGHVRAFVQCAADVDLATFWRIRSEGYPTNIRS
jgi:hypothetical protein